MPETVDGSTVITLHTDQGGHTWHVVVREGGSMCLYSTTTTDHLHHILYDELDKTPPVPAAVAMLDRLGEIARILLALVERHSCPKGGAHEWGIDGAHSNEYCKKCFVAR